MSTERGGPRPQTPTEAFLERHVIGPDLPMPTPRVAVVGGAAVMAVAMTLAVVASYALPLPDPEREARVLSPGRPLAPMRPVQPQLAFAAYSPPAETSYVHFGAAPPPPPAATATRAPPAPIEPEEAMEPPPPPPIEVVEPAQEHPSAWDEAETLDEEFASPEPEDSYEDSRAELVWRSSSEEEEEEEGL